MKEKKKVAALSDTEKQRYSEIFKYLTVLIIDKMDERFEAGSYRLQHLPVDPETEAAIAEILHADHFGEHLPFGVGNIRSRVHKQNAGTFRVGGNNTSAPRDACFISARLGQEAE